MSTSNRNRRADPLNPSYGAATGRAHYEANPNFGISTLWGSGETPGLYPQMEAAWPLLRSRTNAFRAGTAMLPIEWVELENETREERRFNEALKAVMDDRVVLRTGLSGIAQDGREMHDGFRRGWKAFAYRSADAPLYGFNGFWAQWSTPGGLYAPSAELHLTHLLHSACYSATAQNVGFMSAGRGITPLPRERIIWQANAPYGYARGPALLRSLAHTFLRKQEAAIEQEIDTSARAGRATIHTGTSGAPATADIKRAEDAIARGERVIRLPGRPEDGGPSVEFSYPSGSPPNFDEVERLIRADVDDLFGSEVLSIGQNGQGSRAAAEVMASITARAGIATMDELLSMAWESVARWVAFHERYTGRIRKVRVAESKDLSAGDFVTSVTAAHTAGMPMGPKRWQQVADALGMVEEDEARARAPTTIPAHAGGKNATPLAPEEDTAVDPAALVQEEGIAEPLNGAQIKSVSDTLNAVSGNRISTLAAVELLVSVGLERSKAQAMVNSMGSIESTSADAELAHTGARTAYLICGPPGAGKSTRASVISRDVDGPVTTIDVDRYIYGEDGAFSWSMGRSRRAHTLIAHDIRQAIERDDETITIVAPLTSANVRRSVAEPLRAAGYDVRAIQMTPPVDALVARNAERPEGRGVPESPLRAMAERFEPITSAEGFASVEVDDGSRWRMSIDNHAPSCGCRACSSAEFAIAPKHSVAGSDGRDVELYREPLVLSIRGQEYRPEQHYPWASSIDAKAERLADLEELLEREFLPDARNRLFAAAPSDDDFETVKRELKQVAFDIVAAHLDRASADARDARRSEASAQANSGMRAPGQNRGARDWRGFERSTRARINRGANRIASAIVEKVASEVASHYALTGSASGFTPERKARSYVRDVEPLDIALTSGVIDASNGPAGMVVTALVRLSTKRAGRVCDPCKAEDGRVFLIPEQLEEFERYRGVPDPRCTGGTRFCECSWSVVWGRPEDDEDGQ